MTLNACLLPGSEKPLCKIDPVIFTANNRIHLLAVSFCNLIVVLCHIPSVFKTLPPNCRKKIDLNIFKTEVWYLEMNAISTHLIFKSCLMHILLNLYSIVH